MQALRNKFHGKSKRNNRKSVDAPITQEAAPLRNAGAVQTSFKETHQDFPGGHVDQYEKTEVIPSSSGSSIPSTVELIPSSSTAGSSIPTPPPMPPADWKATKNSSNMEFSNLGAPGSTTRTLEMLPTEFIEKPIVVHENIRLEQIEEIQPVVRVEREKTEIRQITQPLTDKEIRPVFVEERTLPVEVLPTINRDFVAAPDRIEASTRSYDSTMRQVIEKTPIVNETEKWRIIEEVQPIIYRETIIPHIIRTSRPMREVIVEAPVFTNQVLQTRELSLAERERYSRFFATQSVQREVIPASSIPILSNPDIVTVATVIAPVNAPVITPVNAPVITPASAVRHQKEIIEETTTTTTTTTVAPTIDNKTGIRASEDRSRIGSAALNAPVVLGKTHTIKTGPMGEKIVTDSVTTTSHSQVLPTRVI